MTTQMPSPEPSLSLNSSYENQSEIPMYHHDPPLIGYPGEQFYILHYTAIVSLAISIAASLAVFIILKPQFPSFWRRTLGERLAIYLALGDLFYSISHIIDHSVMVALIDNPALLPCAIMGYFVGLFIFVQMCMVCFIAFNAFILVVKEMKLNLGRYDWRFLFGTILVPAILFVPLAALRITGPSGAWCLFEVRTIVGRTFQLILSMTQTSVMAVILISYVGVFFKIRQVSSATQAMGSTSGGADCIQVAKVMMKFVVAYIVQWTTLVIYSLWVMFEAPPIDLIYATVFFSNVGGLFNLIVYTLLRRTGKKSGQGDKLSKSKSKDLNTSMSSLEK